MKSLIGEDKELSSIVYVNTGDGGANGQEEKSDFFEIFKKNLAEMKIDLNGTRLACLVPKHNVNGGKEKIKKKSNQFTPKTEDSLTKELDLSLTKELDLFLENYKNEEREKNNIAEILGKNSQETVKKLRHNKKQTIVLSPEPSCVTRMNKKETPSKLGKKTPVDLIPKMLKELEMTEGRDLMFTPTRKRSRESPLIKTVKRKYFRFFDEEEPPIDITSVQAITADFSDDIEDEDGPSILGKRDNPWEEEASLDYQDIVRRRNLEKLGLDRTIKKLKRAPLVELSNAG